RAGRASSGGQVVVQTLHGDEPSILYATSHNYEGFARWELQSRQETNLPPFSRMVRLVVRHVSQEKTDAGANQLTQRLRNILPGEVVQVMGPMPAGVRRIREQFRSQVLLVSSRAGYIQQVLSPRMAELMRDNPAEIVPDVDPLSLV
ncbi:MAG: hypothetical protein ACLFV7_09450, partial [Phycisphaerae bacterium]